YFFFLFFFFSSRRRHTRFSRDWSSDVCSSDLPLVDDDATIILTYENSNAILQPSWNWPIGRKDLEIYGTLGAIYADNSSNLRVRKSEGYDRYKEEKLELKPLDQPYNDPFHYFSAIINNEISIQPSDLS